VLDTYCLTGPCGPYEHDVLRYDVIVDPSNNDSTEFFNLIITAL
jgi:hypothetical protein